MKGDLYRISGECGCGKMKIKEIYLDNILSFKDFRLVLDDLNHIIGPNNSGKSNLIRALRFVRKTLEGIAPRVDVEGYPRNNDLTAPFEIRLKIELSDDEIDKIKYMLNILAKIVHVKVISKLNSKSGDLETGQRNYVIRLKDYNNFLRIWKVSAEKVFSEMFSDRQIDLIIRYAGVKTLPPEVFILINGKVYLTKDDFVFNVTKGRTPSYFSIDFYFLTSIEGVAKPTDAMLMRNVFERIGNALYDGKESIKLDFDLNRMPKEKEKIKHDLVKNANYPERYIEHDISIFTMIKYWIEKHLILSENLRYQTDTNSLLDTLINVKHGYEEVSVFLPYVLYTIKNSPDLEIRKKFHEIQETFKTITGCNFDVVSELQLYRYSILKDPTQDKYDIRRMGANRGDQKGYIEIPNGNIKLVFTSENVQFDFGFVGAGLYELLYILTVIKGHQNKLIVLDEPASNLHPRFQEKVHEEILKEAENGLNRFVVITHSPYMLPDLKMIKKKNEKITMKLFHFTMKNGVTEKKVLMFDPKDKVTTTINRNKWVLFAKTAFIVEGPSEEYIFRKILDDLGFDSLEIGILSGRGEQAIKHYNALMKKGINTYLILDNDKKEKVISEGLKDDDHVILLPSDVEGTLLIGNVLWPPNMKMIDIEIDEKVRKIKSYLLKNISKGCCKKKSSKSKGIEFVKELRDAFKEVIDGKKEIEDLLSDIFKTPPDELDMKEDYLKEVLGIAVKKLDYYLDNIANKEIAGTVDLAVEIVAHDELFKDLPKPLIGKLKKIS